MWRVRFVCIGLVSLWLLLGPFVTVSAQTESRLIRPIVTPASQTGIEFALALDGDQYVVSMRPLVSPARPNLTLTAQVTLKVPHAVGDHRFRLRNLQSSVAGVTWAQNSRVDAPIEDETADYLSFQLIFTSGQHNVFEWVAGQAIEMFRFENNGSCLGPVTLLSNDDPFMSPNSVSTNPGNQIAVLGLDMSNAYAGNTAPGMASCQPVIDLTAPLETDNDGDGILNSVEGDDDLDQDGVPNYLDLDADGDQIPDSLEGTDDVDGDGLPNFLDTDADGDGLHDQTEWVTDADNDGLPNWLDLDSDNDTVLDQHEDRHDTDLDGWPNA